jgi:EAL domain-containing protein (putative c-di-GMP-specific phosphodiesterase class I)
MPAGSTPVPSSSEPCRTGACARSERLPLARPHSGDLYCWFPAPHVEGKARAVFRRHGIVPRATVGDGLLLRDAEAPRESIAEGLERALSQVERDDRRALRCAEGTPPAPADLARVEPLSRLVARVRSGWLLDVLADGRLATHFQPIAHAASPDTVYGHEALLRGQTTTGELIAPGRLFETARSAGLLFPLDLAARRSAIESAARHGLRGSLFVNFAPTAIYDPASCLRTTVAAIDEAGIARDQVVFEIVDTERAHDPTHLRRILDHCRGAGFRVALDDVGSGDSSLNFIHLLRPDVLKLDMELVRNVHADPYKARIAANLLDVADDLGIEGLAEGIETEAELAWVQQHGATWAQGFLIARPSPRPETDLAAIGA